MEAEEITFTLTTLISLFGGVFGAAGAWFALKGKTQLLDLRVKYLETQIGEIEVLDAEVQRNREKMENHISSIKESMHDMEKRIINEIHKIKNGTNRNNSK